MIAKYALVAGLGVALLAGQASAQSIVGASAPASQKLTAKALERTTAPKGRVLWNRNPGRTPRPPLGGDPISTPPTFNYPSVDLTVFALTGITIGGVVAYNISQNDDEKAKSPK